MKAYLANGLFSEADRFYNDYLAGRLRNGVQDLELYVPQENMAINDKNSYADSVMIANGDSGELLTSDFMIAVIDGVEIDSGVACEIGKFTMVNEYAVHGIMESNPIFALFTDSRQQGRDNIQKVMALINDPVENQFPYRNLYVVGEIKKTGGGVYHSIESLIDAINEYYNLPSKSLIK